MAVSERDRTELVDQLRAALGESATMTLLEHLPPGGWPDVATRRDLADLEGRIDVRFDEAGQRVDARFAQAEERVDARFVLMEQRVDAGFALMEERIALVEHRLLAAFRGELNAAITSQTRTMLFAVVGAVVSMGGMALALARLVP